MLKAVSCHLPPFAQIEQAGVKRTVSLERVIQYHSDVLELVSFLNEVDDGLTYPKAHFLADSSLYGIKEGGVPELVRIVKNQIDKRLLKRRIS